MEYLLDIKRLNVCLLRIIGSRYPLCGLLSKLKSGCITYLRLLSVHVSTNRQCYCFAEVQYMRTVLVGMTCFTNCVFALFC